METRKFQIHSWTGQIHKLNKHENIFGVKVFIVIFEGINLWAVKPETGNYTDSDAVVLVNMFFTNMCANVDDIRI